MTSTEWIDFLEGLNYQPHSYSGRGMYGKECVAVVVEDVWAFIATVGEDVDDGFNWSLLRRTHTDGMGRGDVVLYWPSLEWPEAAEEAA